MAIQVINDPYKSFGGSFGAALGGGLGQGLSEGIRQLAQQKYDDLAFDKQQQRMQAAQKLAQTQESDSYSALGLPKPFSDAVAALKDPRLKSTILENLSSAGLITQPNSNQQLSLQPELNLFQPASTRLKQQDLARKTKEGEQKIELGREKLKQQRELSEIKNASQAQKNRIDEEIQRARLKLAQSADENEKRRIENQVKQLENKSQSITAQLEREKTKERRAEEALKLRRETNELAKNSKIEALNLAKQKAIDSKIEPYNKERAVRARASEDIVDKAGEMLNLLQNGNVGAGTTGRFTPLFLANDDSNRFSALGDDIATSLAALSSGQQTISKIKFNKERKPNLAQSRETQLARTYDLLEEAGKVVAENDVANYLIEKNNNQNPDNLRTEVAKILKKINKVPLRSPEDKDGDILEDKKTGIRWIVNGPILRFDGLVEK